jgi:MFS family permease
VTVTPGDHPPQSLAAAYCKIRARVRCWRCIVADQISSHVAEALVDAYYPEYLNRASAARARAQGAYTIAGAVAAAIVAAGVAGDVRAEHWYVQALGVMALAAWLITACLFIRAVAAPIERRPGGQASDVGAFVRGVLERVDREQQTIEARLSQAFTSTVVAVALTFVTLVVALTAPGPSSKLHGHLSLTSEGRRAIGALCGRSPDIVAGRVDPATLGDAFTSVQLDAGTCARQPHTLSLVRGSIVAFAADQ